MSEDDWDKVIAVNLKVVTSEPVTFGPSSLGRELEEDCHPADPFCLVTSSPQSIFLVTQAAAQALVSSGCHGSIINISSIVGKVRSSWEEVSQPSA